MERSIEKTKRTDPTLGQEEQDNEEHMKKKRSGTVYLQLTYKLSIELGVSVVFRSFVIKRVNYK